MSKGEYEPENKDEQTDVRKSSADKKRGLASNIPPMMPVEGFMAASR